MSEHDPHTQPGSIRVLANYLRLGLGLGLGLIWARLLLGALGDAGFGLVMLLGSTAGFGMIIQQAMQAALIREVGAVFHGPDRDAFARTYAGAWALSGLITVATLVVFGALFAALGLLRIPPELLGPGRWLLVAVAIESAALVMLTTPLNMLPITERFGAYNVVLLGVRVGNFVAAVVADRMVAHGASPGEALIWYGFVNTALVTVVRFVGLVAVKAAGVRVLPWARPARAAIKAIAGTGGWNLAISISLNLHVRADALIVNLFFGVEGNAVFGLAVQAAGMVRQLATGMTDGLDAVATRVTTQKGQGGLGPLVTRTSRYQGLVVFPAIVGAAVLFEPLTRLWLGHRLDEIEHPRQLTIVAWIMLVGFGARAISDGWRRVFYGAGYVNQYAPLLLVGGVINPIIALALSKWLDDSIAWTGPATAFAVTMLVFNGVVMIFQCERAAKLPFGVSFGSLGRPLLAAALATPAIFTPWFLGGSLETLVSWFLDGLPAVFVLWVLQGLHSLLMVLLGGVPFCLLYGVLAWLIVLGPQERDRFLRLARLRRGPTPHAARKAPGPISDLPSDPPIEEVDA